jgi:hypothetical protein
MYLLGFSWKAQEALWEMLASGGVGLLPLGDADFSRMRDLMENWGPSHDWRIAWSGSPNGNDPLDIYGRSSGFQAHRPAGIGRSFHSWIARRLQASSS